MKRTVKKNGKNSMLPPSLFYFAGGYVKTSYGGQRCWMLDVKK